MTKHSMRILLIEDDPSDAELLQEYLSENDEHSFVVTWALTLQDGLNCLQDGEFDLVLSDLFLPDSHGAETLTRLLEQASHLPVVVLSGSTDERIALQALQNGTQDYIVKDDIDHKMIVRSLRYAIERKRVQMALLRSEERFSLAARGANDGLWDWDLTATTIYFSPRWKEMLGYDEAEIGPDVSEWFDRVLHLDKQQLEDDLSAHLQGKTSHFENEHRLRHRDHKYRWVLCRGLAIRDDNGTPLRMAGSLTDITRRRSAEEKLKHDAMHDELTGLPNRTFFTQRLEEAIALTKQKPEFSFAVLFLDLDRFKVVNDSLGHLIGDQLLCAVSSRLETCLRFNDMLARFGGDEFVILLDDVGSRQDVTNVADSMQAMLAAPFHIGEHTLFTTVSIGIALGDGEFHQAEELLRGADTAMYKAKTGGKARYALFDSDQHKSALNRLSLETDLHQALGQNELVVYYQPLVSLASEQVVGVEALLRWQHAKFGLLTPNHFIALAEETGLILPIGEWVLKTVCYQTQKWHEMGFPELRVTVNISARQFRDQNLLELVADILTETGLPASCLELEIIDAESILDHSGVLTTVNKLRERNVRTAMDDFGFDTSLHALKTFPVDTLKIDQSFISGIEKDDCKKISIIRAIIAMGHGLNLNVVAEGVETNDQLEMLRQLNCNEIQGYLISAPVPAAKLTELLQNPLLLS